jgi:hypothetical protein
MTKPTITRLFVGGLIAIVAGIVLAAFGVFWLFASGSFTVSGPDITGFTPTTFTWSVIAVVVAAGLTIVGGAVAGLVAWIGALLNTVQLDDKTWFVILLVLGLLSFGFIAMVAYVIAGPDGTRPEVRARFSIDVAARA